VISRFFMGREQPTTARPKESQTVTERWFWSPAIKRSMEARANEEAATTAARGSDGGASMKRSVRKYGKDRVQRERRRWLSRRATLRKALERSYREGSL